MRFEPLARPQQQDLAVVGAQGGGGAQQRVGAGEQRAAAAVDRGPAELAGERAALGARRPGERVEPQHAVAARRLVHGRAEGVADGRRRVPIPDERPAVRVEAVGVGVVERVQVPAHVTSRSPSGFASSPTNGAYRWLSGL
ncbi:hypothetical protein [Actinomadura madurae]|uniref:hypothetical protein n=1 Tax=Actinomadura madurae TaxID=1993 RepID=UPI002025B855|nr:hypothetical protein [Actinomadura madurae]MCP9970971.1 hypothetical protein [Actinomadura madurae]MCP9983449.1 hypothetical protein [Actinomadura madurae]URN10377.1 hypothetical protein LUW74_48285 [Actinomadura madurae]